MLSATDRPSIICFIWDTVLLIIIVCNWFFLPAFPMDKYHQWIESEQLPFQMQLLSCLVRVANELGAGNGKGAKFATTVAVVTSVIIGLFFWLLIMMFHNEFGYIFTNSEPVLTEVSKLSLLLAFTILLNSVQPVLSGVAVGSGWQSYVAYINLGCYYLIGVPLGFLMGWFFHQGVMGIWAGMIFGGTAVQTLILAIITIRCDWDKEAEKASMHVLRWADKN